MCYEVRARRNQHKKLLRSPQTATTRCATNKFVRLWSTYIWYNHRTCSSLFKAKAHCYRQLFNHFFFSSHSKLRLFVSRSTWMLSQETKLGKLLYSKACYKASDDIRLGDSLDCIENRWPHKYSYVSPFLNALRRVLCGVSIRGRYLSASFDAFSGAPQKPRFSCGSCPLA